ncbi:MAG: hypothetical protein L0338_39725 [Acidobacteria bacterium]|nr:hypothetical protein [Acidobacteriota bacterium]
MQLEPVQRNFSGVPLARCRVYRSTNQTINSGTLTPVVFDTRSFDTFGAMWQMSEGSKIFVPVRGIYAARAHVRWQASAAGGSDKATSLTLNGDIIDTDNKPLDATVERSAKVGLEFYAEAGQYVELKAFQNSGAGLNLIASSTYGIYLQVFLMVPFL